MTNETFQDLVFVREFNAPVERVWRAWTDADALKQWWGPDHFVCPTATMDVREGGTSIVSMASPELGFPEQFSVWRHTAVIPMERLEFVMNLSDASGVPVNPATIGMPADFPMDVVHEVLFQDLGDGRTRLTVTEKNWPEGQMREMSSVGMTQSLEKLARAVGKNDERS